MPKRRSTIAAQVDIAKTAGQIIDPPAGVTLTRDARDRFDRIVRARARDTWTEIDLEHAANLACCLADLERLRCEVRTEGDTITNQRGTEIVNPKHTLMEVLSRRSVALSRLLHVHAEATQGRSRDSGVKKQAEAKVDAAMSQADDDDDLDAKPEWFQ